MCREEEVELIGAMRSGQRLQMFLAAWQVSHAHHPQSTSAVVHLSIICTGLHLVKNLHDLDLIASLTEHVSVSVRTEGNRAAPGA